MGEVTRAVNLNALVVAMASDGTPVVLKKDGPTPTVKDIALAVLRLCIETDKDETAQAKVYRFNIDKKMAPECYGGAPLLSPEILLTEGEIDELIQRANLSLAQCHLVAAFAEALGGIPASF